MCVHMVCCHAHMYTHVPLFEANLLQAFRPEAQPYCCHLWTEQKFQVLVSVGEAPKWRPQPGAVPNFRVAITTVLLLCGDLALDTKGLCAFASSN